MSDNLRLDTVPAAFSNIAARHNAVVALLRKMSGGVSGIKVGVSDSSVNFSFDAAALATFLNTLINGNYSGLYDTIAFIAETESGTPLNIPATNLSAVNFSATTFTICSNGTPATITFLSYTGASSSLTFYSGAGAGASLTFVTPTAASTSITFVTR